MRERRGDAFYECLRAIVQAMVSRMGLVVIMSGVPVRRQVEHTVQWRTNKQVKILRP